MYNDPMHSNTVSEGAVQAPADKTNRSLAELYPEEITFFAKRFVWAANRSGFYVRHGYFGKEQGWYARKRGGDAWLPVYPSLAADLIEKHLDFERFCKLSDWLGPIHPRNDETAFWFGMMAGEYTYHDCIDLDSHDRIGMYGVPSRFHPERNGNGEWLHWHDHRMLPVMRLGLDYFKKLKLFHMHFPRRVWSFSSGSLGMYMYNMFPRSEKPAFRYGVIRDRLKALRMDVLGGVPVEVYPEPPKTEGSKGHQQRRPCGMDMGVITDAGVVTDPIEQIRIFMEPRTPSFEAIVGAVTTRLLDQYRAWIEFEDYLVPPKLSSSHERFLKAAKQALFDEQLTEVDRIREWLRDGCPNLESVLHDPPRTSTFPSCPISCGGISERVQGPETRGEEPSEQGDGRGTTATSEVDPFVTCDLTTINGARQWVPFVLFLAEHGFPSEDSFLPVISTLAKWLYFYELYDLPADERKIEIKELLTTYCLNKHNGYITRLTNGQVGEVTSNVHRLVDHSVETVDDTGKFTFMQMRSKRDRGQYQTIYKIVPLIIGPTPSVASAPDAIACGMPTDEGGEAADGWSYVPDDTRLPHRLEGLVLEAFRASGYKMRRNKDGAYPLLKAVTRLINYLSESRSFQRRASQRLLVRMGFPDKSRPREKIKSSLYNHKIIIKGDYQSRTRSRKYILTERAIDLLVERRIATLA